MGSIKGTNKRWWSTQVLETEKHVYPSTERSKKGNSVTGIQYKLLLGEGAPAGPVVLSRDNTTTEKLRLSREGN